MKSKLKIVIPIIIVIVIIAVVMVILTSNNKTKAPKEISKEEIIQQAIDIEWWEISQERSQNIARANEKYLNKYYKYTGVVRKIEQNSCLLGQDPKTTKFVGMTTSEYIHYIDVSLPTEELAKLDVGSTITVVGKLTRIEYSFAMKPAYILKNAET